MKRTFKNLTAIVMALLSIMSVFALPAFATEGNTDNYSTNSNTYMFNETKTTADNNGYANPSALGAGDPLLGVNVVDIEIGNFSSTTIFNGKRVFLKTSPDVPVLSINLNADLSNLGGSGAYVCSDSATVVSDYGYRGKVGYGLLAIEHTDHTGKKETFFIPDLFNVLKENGDIIPAFFGEEGSYRISVFFETERYVNTVKDWKNPFYYKKKKVYEYRNYRVDTGRFELRNGNTMVYTFNSAGNEISNGSVVTDGFYLDLANSHYLDVQLQKEVIGNSGFLGETTDTRFNTVGVDKRFYDSEGLYTIVVSNPVTGASTTKKILVAGQENSTLKKAVATTYSSDFPELVRLLAEEEKRQNEMFETNPNLPRNDGLQEDNEYQKDEFASSFVSSTTQSDTNETIKLAVIIFVLCVLLTCFIAGAVILIKKVS